LILIRACRPSVLRNTLFLHRVNNDKNDHDDVWQDGAVFVDMGKAGWGAYCTGSLA
jgi:hypothetical protein